METNIQNTFTQSIAVKSLLKLLAVFLPALVVIAGSKSWVGEDPVRGMTVIWVANVIMLTMVWGIMKSEENALSLLGLDFGKLSTKKLLTVFGLSLVVFVLAVVAFLIGPVLLPEWVNVPAEADFSRYDFLRDNPLGLILSLLGVYLVSSFGEEVIYRAFLMHQISEMVRGKKLNNVISIVGSAIIFGLVHYEWGAMGIIQSSLMGLVLAICYIKLEKRLWILILAHAYMDTLLLVQLYFNLN